MIGPKAIILPIPGGLRLMAVLTPCGKGWSYQVQDGHGRAYASGWTRGRKSEAFEEACKAVAQ